MIRALILFLALSAPAHAGPDRVSLMLGSHHVAASAVFEEVNPGIFLTWEDRAFGLDYTVGAFRNSFGRGAVAGLVAWPVWQQGETQAALFAGVAHYPGDGRRHRFHAGDFIPVAGLQIRHRNVFAQIMPSDGRTARAVVAVGLTFKFAQ
jgi:hypothetical protein